MVRVFGRIVSSGAGGTGGSGRTGRELSDRGIELISVRLRACNGILRVNALALMTMWGFRGMMLMVCERPISHSQGSGL